MDTNITQVAAATVTALAPYMPLLIYTAKFTAEAIGEMVVQKGGELAWQRAQSLWGKIKARFGDDGVIDGAATMVAAKPEDANLQKILATQLAERLKQQPELANELLELLGGKESMQKIIADRSSWVEDVTQEMAGSGSQIVRASDDSVIKGVKQIKK